MAEEQKTQQVEAAAIGAGPAPHKLKLTLISLERSRSHRIAWLLEELGLEYEIVPFKRNKDQTAPPELKKYHPLGKSPVLLLDDNLTLAESGAIMEYMIDHYGPELKPPVVDSPPMMQYRYLMYYVEGSFMPWMVLALITNMIKNLPVPFFIKPITAMIANRLNTAAVTPNLTDNFNFLENMVKETGWFVGEGFTGADIMVSFPLTQARIGRLDPDAFNKEKYPSLFAWMDKIRERPAYKRADERLKAAEEELKK